MRLILLSLSAAACLVHLPLLANGQEGIHTSRSGRPLALPKGDDMFHFVIYGDRTGGPPEGIAVLEQAVKDTNLLDPDLVMTVGDLINGYNQETEWMEEMREYRGVMNELRMPWFPVAGNHDVYWRGKNPEERPELEHEGNYEKHFGPLWYWFAHKDHGFLVLYTDETGDASKPKSFQDKDQIQMSQEQLDWLSQSLKEMKDLKQVFVFLHHPRWLSQYRESNWPEVHQRLAEAGNVRAVFAGHIHRLNYGGVKDGIEYFALATTGGSMPGHMPQIGYVHHLNIVTVRDEGMSMAILPVGSAIDPRLYGKERLGELDALRTLTIASAYGPLRLDAEGSINAEYAARCHNPTSEPIEITLTALPKQGDWRIMPSHRHLTLAPNETRDLAFRVQRSASSMEGFALPSLTLDIDYLEASGARVTLPSRQFEMPVTLSSALPEAWFAAGDNKVLQLGGEGALRLDSKSLELSAESPLTLEAWIQVGEGNKSSHGVLAKTENSEFGFFLHEGQLQFDVLVGDSYQSVQTPDKLAIGEWFHIAGVYDLNEVRLYVDGKRIGTKATSGPRKLNTHPFYVGADPSSRGQATRHFRGKIDEVRLSRVARYEGESFERRHRHEPDADTVLLLHLDQSVGGVFHIDHGPNAAHAVAVGKGAVLASEDLPALDTD